MPRAFVGDAYGLDSALERVAEFQRRAGQPAPSTPRPLTPARVTVRAAWMQEEVDEFLGASSLVDQTDAMLDLIYFALGSLVELGVPAEPLFDIVHLANMQKFNADSIRRRSSDGKVLKTDQWTSPEKEIARVLTTQSSKFDLRLADDMSSLEACVRMVADHLAPNKHIGDDLLRSQIRLKSVVTGYPLNELFEAIDVGVTDDYQHISVIEESMFLSRLGDALTSYDGIGLGYDRRVLDRQEGHGHDNQFLLVGSVGINEITIIDPSVHSPGPRAVNPDDLFAAVKSAGDGIHKFIGDQGAQT